MRISASILNSHNNHSIKLRTDDNSHTISLPPKPSGFGSSINGGELLFLALATCYCNDVYREASKRNLEVNRIEVFVEGDFMNEGEAARNVIYRVRIESQSD